MHVCEERVHRAAIRRKAAYGISGGGIGSEEHGLAAAAAKVLPAAIAGLAGSLHPFLTAKPLEGFARLPNFPQRLFLHIFKGQTRNDGGGMAGEGVAARRDEHQLASPSAHAGLRKLRMVVGNDVFDAELTAEAILRLFQEFNGLRDLFPRGKKLFAIGEGPAVVLDVREFDTRGARGFRNGEHLRKLLEIVSMNDEVERYRHTARFEPIEDPQFLLVCFGVGDFGGRFRASALKTELQMIEPRYDERVEASFVHGKAGGDEIDVETRGAGGLDEIDQIGARERFTTCQIELKNTGVGSLAKDAGPLFGCQFFGARGQLGGIRAINAVEGAAVG